VLNLYRGDKFKITAVIAIFIFMVAGFFVLTYVNNSIEIGVRGYLIGETHWSKAQKSATLSLIKYLNNKSPESKESFENALKSVEGYKQARMALLSDPPDYDLAMDGFVKGGSHEDDALYMVRLYNYFGKFEAIQEAVRIWQQGDDKIGELVVLADSLDQKLSNPEVNLTDPEKDRYLSKILDLDQALTRLEIDFTKSLREASLQLNNIIYWVALLIGLILVGTVGVLTIAIISNTKKWNRELNDAREKLQKIIENSGDVIYLMNLETRQYSYMSSSVEKMLGYPAETVMKGGPDFIFERTHPDDLERIKSKYQGLATNDLESQIKINTEFRVMRSDGEYIWVNNKRALIRDENGNPVALVGNVRDISKRKEHEEEIDRSLMEKQVLLQEIHHRVKNNLAIISSLLELQKDGVAEEVSEIFKETQSRIQSIALVHEKLYQSDTLAEINLSEYLNELTDVIAQAYGSASRKVKLEKEFDDLKINITDAIPLGLVFNELVNNVYKHAFNGQSEGILELKLKHCGSIWKLSVSDNGKGLPENFSLEEQQSLGMTLISALSNQLEAEVNISSNGWTTFEIDFKVDNF